ncbi:MAG TPA: outer membrane lipoprotein-sorting protein, partial [Gammaproteobacteria bacterium]|nr:outer membrane lipoprotein-sorting protein [Gammaproteobacteria bacterium]
RSLEVAGDGDKSLTIFSYPADIKGTVFLSHTHPTRPDEQWLYLPALKRIKRISSSNKSGPFMGSEFAYEDLASQEIENQCNHGSDQHRADISITDMRKHNGRTGSGYLHLIQSVLQQPALGTCFQRQHFVA